MAVKKRHILLITEVDWIQSVSFLVERVSKKENNTGRCCCQCLHLQQDRHESTALFHVLTAVGTTKANSVKCHACSHVQSRYFQAGTGSSLIKFDQTSAFSQTVALYSCL